MTVVHSGAVAVLEGVVRDPMLGSGSRVFDENVWKIVASVRQEKEYQSVFMH